ncbi:DUF362 domain-containing protein [bacterium]|nr:DUF362 domain-containing protein [bacterium]
MNRREVLKLLSVGCLSSFFSPLNLFSKIPDNQSDTLPITLYTDTNLDPYRLAENALELFGGLQRIINRGDVVVVKPNIGWDRIPLQAANTNPRVIEAIIKKCYDAGAKTVNVFDNTCNDPRRSYIRSGIKEAVIKSGGNIEFIDEKKFKDMNINGEKLKKWKVYSKAVECDKFINVPILKHHSLAGLTISMKNLMGVVSDPRNIWHKDLDNYLVDITRFIKPSLTIIDAFRTLFRNGPSGGTPDDVKMLHSIIISKDPVGADSQAAELMGVPIDSLKYIKLAQSMSLGSFDLPSSRIIKRQLN